MKPKTLTDFSWFDSVEGDVIIAITDKTTMTFSLAEFSELFGIFENTRTNLLEMSEISVGSFEREGEIHEELIHIPSDEEYN